MTFYTLRHTYCSHAVMNGMPLLLLAKNLGHEDTKMVEKHYGHLADDYVKKQIRRYAPRFSFAAKPKLGPGHATVGSKRRPSPHQMHSRLLRRVGAEHILIWMDFGRAFRVRPRIEPLSVRGTTDERGLAV